MNLIEHQKAVIGFMNPEVLLQGNEAVRENAILGMGGEGGEIVDLWKKFKFHGREDDWDEMDKEFSDALFYIQLYCDSRDITLEDLAAINYAKLSKRYESTGGKFTAAASRAKADENG